MVLKPERNRDSIQFSDNSTGYLVCSECNGYYKLQENETPEDFEKCECGSLLTYYESIPSPESSLMFSSTTLGQDSVKSFKPSDEIDSKQVNPLKQDNTNTLKTGEVSENEFIMNRFSKQNPVSDEVLNTLQRDKGSLWNNVAEFNSKKSVEHRKVVMDDVIEVNRLMMMVDEKRALEESNNSSKMKSVSTRMGPIGFLSAAIVLLITVLALTLAGELV